MLKKIFVTFICFFSALTSYAFEECIITGDGKLSDIKIEHNDIIDVYPLFTLMNEKNTLFVQPLKEGETHFCVLKNGKEIITFNVKVGACDTKIDEVKGFEILSIDTPPMQEEDFELDLPPEVF